MATGYSYFLAPQVPYLDWQGDYQALAGVFIVVYKRPVFEEVKP